MMKKLLLVSGLLLTTFVPSFSYSLKDSTKAAAEAVAALACYTNPQYQNNKKMCEFEYTTWDSDYNILYKTTEPTMIKVRKDGILKIDGKDMRVFYFYLYDGDNNKLGGGAALISVNPPQYFEKREEARCNRRHIRRPSFIARVNGAYTARVNGAYTARVTPSDDCK